VCLCVYTCARALIHTDTMHTHPPSPPHTHEDGYTHTHIHTDTHTFITYVGIRRAVKTGLYVAADLHTYTYYLQYVYRD